MNKFDKLYNLILESILTQDIESKIKKAIQTLIKSGQLKDQDDPKAELVKTIIKRNNSIDINGKTKLDQLLKANEKYTTRQQYKDNSKNIISYIDNNIPQFSQKKIYDNGVVIYKVEQSKAGQEVVRKIIDAQWSEKANPWCLASRAGGLDRNYRFWKRYRAYPKHIAFQNGQLLAFCADEKGNCTWWDRNDKRSKKLKLLDGKRMTTDSYIWTKEQLDKIFLKENNLTLNKQTGLYDSDGDVKIYDKDLIDGHFPVKFGNVKGDFDCYNCTTLISLEGGPKYVGGHFSCNQCKNLISLQGAPKTVGGNFDCSHCSNLTSLEGAPKKIGEDFNCSNCPKLKNNKRK